MRVVLKGLNVAGWLAFQGLLEEVGWSGELIPEKRRKISPFLDLGNESGRF